MQKDTLRAEPGYPQDLWIPYDMEERKKKFKTAFEDLAVYMDHIRAEQARGAPD